MSHQFSGQDTATLASQGISTQDQILLEIAEVGYPLLADYALVLLF